MDTELLSKTIKKFFNNEGFEVEVDYDIDFGYVYSSSTIYYSFLIPDKSGEYLMEFAKQHGLQYDCGSFVLSLFHELGHNETMDFLDEQEEEESLRIKKTLSTSKEDNFIYFNLPDEIVATEWAIDYINNNKQKIQSLIDEIKPMIDSIFSELIK